MSEEERNEIRRILAELLEQLRRSECRTCDCFQGFLTQLELDSETDISEITNPLTVGTDEMHGCLGCDPCPPGAAFAQYLKKRQDASRNRMHAAADSRA